MTDQVLDALARSDNEIELTAEIVSAYVSKNPVPIGELPALIASIHNSLASLSNAPEQIVEALKPAVSIKKSVTDDYIVCLEDGKRFKSLKRHLMTHFNMTPEEYRAKWSLPSDYPMVAPNYAAARSKLAKSLGLGRKSGAMSAAAPAKRGRPKKA